MGNRFLVPNPVQSGMTLLSTTTLSGASVTISNIPPIYKSLIGYVNNLLPADDATFLYIRANSDSGTNYLLPAASADAQTVNVNRWTASPASDNAVATAGFGVFEIFDYANTTHWKLMKSSFVTNNQTTTTNLNFRLQHGIWNQTTAISSLQLLMSSGNLTSGTLLLYGVN